MKLRNIIKFLLENKKVKLFLVYPFLLIFFIIVAFFTLNFLFPINNKISYSTIVTDKNNEIIHAFLAPDEKWRIYVALEEISPALKKAIVFKEDKYFYQHFGVNPLAIGRAIYRNLLKRRRTSGASTITMQVARLLKPKKRTYFNKLVEAFRAFQLEYYYSKEEILQLYLNLVPYGGNIEGVKSASLLYFKKNPNHLSLAEITTLCVIPNQPSSLQIGKKNKEIQVQRNKWLKGFLKRGLFKKDEIYDALNEPLIAYRHEAPKLAPHFSYKMLQDNIGEVNIKTCLSYNIQKKTARLVKNYVQRLVPEKIENSAVIVIDNYSRKVVAYVGSSDFYNIDTEGQVDGIQAVRQPGSTLKPLLYALAIDEGLITAKTVVTDVPVNFNAFQPENFDKTYSGYVTVEKALAQSLNIPAVKILSQIKVKTLVNTLIKAGFKQVEKDKEKLGLSTVLGGCGTTLEEITALYATLANEGVYVPVQYTQGQRPRNKKRITSSASTYIITEILTKLNRPDFPNFWNNSTNLPKIAWKTGTSYGRRDAWSIGYNKRYTVGVWLGNFSGEGVQSLTGAQIATPLLFEIFNTIDYNSPNKWYQKPKILQERKVCSTSGFIPNLYCKELVNDSYIPFVSTNRSCDHAIKVWVNNEETISYCRSCFPTSNYQEVYFENHPPEIIAFYEAEKIPYEKIPVHNPSCERIFSMDQPSITHPVEGLTYWIDKRDSAAIMLTCETANNVEHVFWYINDKFLGTAKYNEKVFFHPPQGKIKISCSDDKGRNTNLSVEVKYID